MRPTNSPSHPNQVGQGWVVNDSISLVMGSAEKHILISPHHITSSTARTIDLGALDAQSYPVINNQNSNRHHNKCADQEQKRIHEKPKGSASSVDRGSISLVSGSILSSKGSRRRITSD
ncbi:hypothetical protein Droror1_Dr00010980 [Drosera rotundifolia]